MAELVRVRGLSRQGIRLGNIVVRNNVTKVIDLDDAKTRQALAHHSAIGAVTVVGDIGAAIQTGVVCTNGTTTTVTTSAGTLTREDGQVVTVAGANNQALASAPDATNPRIDLVVVNNGSGAVSQQAGTAAATPAIPRPTGDVTTIARLNVAANASTPAGVVITDVAPRLS